ncbi:SDR family NAD(P)-dependent oxidoreductase [Streptomyces mirabilis]|uniref:SDR family NAD(P)-dependent oxidoreductase n=1 Tax=Streptomyces mirabilis TaxID=68239 RepID=UPI0036CA1496
MSTPLSPTPLSGKTALVTGAGRGLGAAVAQLLSHAGAQVVLVGRTEATLKAAAASLPGETLVVPADLSSPDAPAQVLGQAIAVFGSVDILVNNAGVGHGAGSDELSSTDIDQVLALNLKATLLLAGAAAAHMAGNGGGSIISISSALSALGTPRASLYAASKGGVDAATRALAAEWGPHQVRVNAIRPAVTRSDMARSLIENEAMVTTYLKRVPMGRVGEAEDVARAALFFASPDSSYITGQILDVDGGWSTTAPSIFATE